MEKIWQWIESHGNARMLLASQINLISNDDGQKKVEERKLAFKFLYNIKILWKQLTGAYWKKLSTNIIRKMLEETIYNLKVYSFKRFHKHVYLNSSLTIIPRNILDCNLSNQNIFNKYSLSEMIILNKYFISIFI